jgi:hypothetical protein
LDKTSYNRYHDFISFAALPKSFQDAIHITRFLDLKYLWIDSFCIQQDSAVDFDIEASKMADVYRDSFIVIVAAASDNSHGGCLIKSDPDKFIRIQIYDGSDFYFGMRQCKFAKFLDGMAEVYSEFPTHERAWCYQEQILSQRLLYCNRTELAFECRDMRRCECGSTRMEPHVTTAAARKLLSIRNPELSMILNLAQQKSFSIANINARWEAVVTYYSRLKLLRPEQRLSRSVRTGEVIPVDTGSTWVGNHLLIRAMAQDYQIKSPVEGLRSLSKGKCPYAALHVPSSFVVLGQRGQP